MKEHPDYHKCFALKMMVVHKKEEYRNREDAHGGPGYTEVEVPIATFYKEIPKAEVANTINRVARGEVLR